MTAAIDIIEDALQHLGASSPINPAPPETLTAGLQKLNELLDEWQIEELRTGVTTRPATTADELDENFGLRGPMGYALAFKMSTIVRRPISADLSREGLKSINVAREQYQYTIPDRRPASVLGGQGNRVPR